MKGETMNLESMSKSERSLLLYFESCAVNQTGRIDSRKMNANDFTIAKKWNESKFVKFGRISFKDIMRNFTNWCELSDEAWELAHKERKARHERMAAKRAYRKSTEE